jgi:hypothetical protein
MQDDQLAFDMLAVLILLSIYLILQPCNAIGAISSAFFNMSSNTTTVSKPQQEEPSLVPEKNSRDVESNLPRHEDCPALPPLDIEAATSTNNTNTGQRKMSGWSAADSCWTSTTVEQSVESSIMDDIDTAIEHESLGKSDIFMEKYNTEAQLLKRSSPSLTSSSTKDKSISDVALSLPALPLPAEDPGRVISMSLVRKIALVLVACLAQFLNLGGMNQTVAPVMVLADYFHIVDYGTLSWFSAAYSMTVGTFILPAGKPQVSRSCFDLTNN